MRNDHYPQGTVEKLLPTSLVTPNTRRVLEERLHQPPKSIPEFFDAGIFLTLQAVAARLIPQDTVNAVDLAGLLDESLFKGVAAGWRYNRMPENSVAFPLGLTGISETAEWMFAAPFHLVAGDQQDEVLSSVQWGTAKSRTWESLPAALFFEELLAALTALYYSHPYAKNEIGEVAMADAGGWKKIALNEKEAWEPEAVNTGGPSID